MIIYQAKNLINNKCYIGQTICELKKRKSEHLFAAKNGYYQSNYFYNAIRKYKEDFFEWTILEDNISHINKLNWLEEFCIAYYESLAPKGYNLTTGGKNWIRAEEVSKRQAETIKNKSDEEKVKRLKKFRKTMNNKSVDDEKERIRRLLETINNKSWEKKIEESRKRSKLQTGKKKYGFPCIIFNNKYKSIKAAIEKLKISRYFIKKELDDPYNKHYQYL